MNQLVIQEMDLKDLSEVVAIAASSASNPWSENMFIGEMSNPLAHCFIVRMKTIPNDPLTGFICFRNVGDESELLNICIHPQFRQLGIAKKLMQFYVDFCSLLKIRTFHLEVEAMNQAALHLYRSFSYQWAGARKNFYQGNLDALLMLKKI